MSAQPRNPKDLTFDELVDIVATIQNLLWADYETNDDGVIQGSDYWDPSKEWEIEHIELVADALEVYGLAPKELVNIPPNWI